MFEQITAVVKSLLDKLSQTFITKQQLAEQEAEKLARTQDRVVSKYMQAQKHLS
jgi:hypothetical protein